MFDIIPVEIVHIYQDMAKIQRFHNLHEHLYTFLVRFIMRKSKPFIHSEIFMTQWQFSGTFHILALQILLCRIQQDKNVIYCIKILNYWYAKMKPCLNRFSYILLCICNFFKKNFKCCLFVLGTRLQWNLYLKHIIIQVNIRIYQKHRKRYYAGTVLS